MEIFKNKLIVHGLIIIDEKYIVIKRSAIKEVNLMYFLNIGIFQEDQ